MRRCRLTGSVVTTLQQRQWLRPNHSCIMISMAVSLSLILLLFNTNLRLNSDFFVFSWQILPIFKHSRRSCQNASLRRQSIGVPTPQRLTRNRSRNMDASPTLLLASKLWDRLQIEEDDEPMWYLLNCVATNEIDLLRQCRQIFANMDDPAIQKDVIKFIVPIEKKTRSHGANKMVTETKVKYPGYVFAKLRLCPIVYETIQGLDLCRSWMGTVNHKGYKKLPPAPLALNEDEIDNFGLEEVMEDVDDDESSKNADQHTVDADGIIIDSSDDDENDMDDDEYNDPMYKNIDKKSLKQYKGFKVEDMVKVVQKGKFYNEDGIVRRLKDGQIFVRFYTYGTMFEEWISPSDLRKLSAEEVLRGLSGSTQPITQKDFDENNGISDPQQQQRNRPMDVRDALRSSPGSSTISGDRNRRQDRMADRFKGNNSLGGNVQQQQRDADKNWNWYKEQQQQSRRQDSVVGMDSEWTIRAGSNNSNENNNNNKNTNRWAESDVDSQWGRPPPRQVRNDGRRASLPNTSDSYIKNRLTEAAIDGTADWSAFVTPSQVPPSRKEMSTSTDQSRSSGGGSSDSDDFFASLMSDLKKDLPVEPTPRDNQRSSPSQRQYQPESNAVRQQRAIPKTESQNTGTNVNAADDFFSSLMSDLNQDISGPMTSNQKRSGQVPVPTVQPSSVPEDDFFASLMSDLNTSPVTPVSSLGDNTDVQTYQSKVRSTVVETNNDDPTRQDDDFFASLEAELESSLRMGSTEKTNTIDATSTKTDDPPLRTPLVPASDLEKKTIPVLKDMLRERGLKVSGTKAELMERLSST